MKNTWHNNGIIAKYMGAKGVIHGTSSIAWEFKKESKHQSALTYHRNWNKLIPVLQKARQDAITSGGITLSSKYLSIMEELSKFDILAVHLALTKFIILYNEINSNKD